MSFLHSSFLPPLSATLLSVPLSLWYEWRKLGSDFRSLGSFLMVTSSLRSSVPIMIEPRVRGEMGWERRNPTTFQASTVVPSPSCCALGSMWPLLMIERLGSDTVRSVPFWRWNRVSHRRAEWNRMEEGVRSDTNDERILVDIIYILRTGDRRLT